ncbi:MAG TPA: carboxypeptidase regulatory-like domain-containing protein [Terracidiphilus sp.]|nr:carboxypeptidase regulatory-like domain-containing protein [Terracidiphilus sp.]
MRQVQKWMYGFGIFVLAAGMLGITPLAAQTATSSGSFAGRVTDKAGGVMPGTDVTLTNVATGIVRHVPSSKSGTFNFALVQPGTYIVTAAKSGFAKANSAPTEVAIGQTITVNFTMQPASQNQTVEVTAQTPLVNTAQTGVAGNISPTQVQSLPLNGNDYGSLAVLVPGIKPVAPYDPTKSRVATFSVDGSTGRNVNVTVNGVEDKDNSVGGPVMQLPLNAVQEFKVSPSRFSAANGRSEGASINVVEKEGTNQFHGGAQLYFTDTSLNANDYFSKKGGNATPQFDRQQEGADIGGPIRKNKDFFFFAFWHDNEKTALPIDPTAYADLVLAEPLGAKPAQTIPTPFSENRYSTRVDHTINSSNHLSFNFNWQSNYGLNDQVGSTNDSTSSNFTKNDMILGGLTWDSIINPTTINSFTAGYQYWNNLIDTTLITPYNVSFPDASFGTNGNVPQNTTQKKWEFRDDLSITHGSHNLQFGEDYMWEPFLGGFFEFNEVPSVGFSDNASVIVNNTNGEYPQGFATPGAVTSMSLTAGDPFYVATGGVKMSGTYAQDDWQVNQRLRLNLGVRYEVDTNTYGEADQAKARAYLALKAIGNPYASHLPTTDLGDLAPIFGFTYDLTGHGTQLLRGGFGMYYGQTFQNIPLFMLQQTDPTMFGTVYSVTLSKVGGSCSNCDVPGTNIPLSNYRMGADPAPKWTAGAPTAIPSGGTGQLVDPNYRNPVSEQWNLGYTWGIDPADAIMIDYVHSLGLHESQYVNINPIIDVGSGARKFDAAFQGANVTPLGPITTAESTGRSRYDSLSIEWKRRMTHNFSLDGSYTLARALAWGGSAASFGNRPATLDQWNPVNFGPTGTDQRHRIVFSGIFNLPWGINVAPIMQWASAPPYSATMGQSIFGYGSGFATPFAIVPNSDPTDYTYTQQKDSSGNLIQKPFVSGNYYTLPCLQAGTCHELAINSLRGQSFFDLDTRFGKRINISDSTSVNLFFQAFDLTNRANFSRFNSNIRSGTFMTPSGYISGSGVTIPKAFRGEFGVELIF